MSGKYEAPKEKKFPVWLLVLLAIAIVAILALATLMILRATGVLGGQPTQPSASAPPSVPTQPSSKPTEPSSKPTEPPTEPPITKIATATIANTGDVLMHRPLVTHNYDSETGTYNFDVFFRYFAPYIQQADFAVANLEVTLCGTDNGYGYSYYPGFNCPDAIATSLKTAGFDLVLTANNHCYDTRTVGLLRTQQVVEDAGLLHVGTVPDTETPRWLVQDINGIRVGMMCYTYETTPKTPGGKSLNGIPLAADAAELVCSFDYNDLDAFYQEVEQNLTEMQEAGAEATVMYIHWGNEYKLVQNGWQSQIAQKLCDLGIDVIVGGHPHVIQPMELLQSSVDETHKTVCLYSTGNMVSGQRRYEMNLNTGHTEDGILFHFTFAKYSDGTVILESAEIVPLWLNLYRDPNTDLHVYHVLPLDQEVPDWRTAYDLDDLRTEYVDASYQRTMDIVGEGLTQIQTYLTQHTAEVEQALGVQPAA